jgi:hypothetical protein
MTKRTTRTRAEAKKLMWEYYRKNKESLPSCINRLREEILDRLVASQTYPSKLKAASFIAEVSCLT